MPTLRTLWLFLFKTAQMIVPNLLLIAGTGIKSGKTTIACRIIEQFSNLNITAIKISPHFHVTTLGLNIIYEEEGYAIYKETNSDATKDTSRMYIQERQRSILPKYLMTDCYMFLIESGILYLKVLL